MVVYGLLVRWLNVDLLVVWLRLCMVGLLVMWLNVDLLVVWLWLCMVCLLVRQLRFNVDLLVVGYGCVWLVRWLNFHLLVVGYRCVENRKL